MVFESLVVELINRYLGDFVENLDTSQLKIGIWGGDVVLNHLHFKESALDDLDLPVKIKAGHIGKLVLKIPWKNLYKEAVVAEIDGIYALAIPNVGIKYNAEREEKALQEAKQKKLAQIEEAKKIEAQKGQPKEEKVDSFGEKLATQIIKNLQVKVSNIHIRYEDRFTNPKRPFSIGVTLQELLFQTTDENWKPCVIKDAVTQIFKLVKLDSLSVYWNSCSPLLDGMDKDQILEMLQHNIANQGVKTDYQYVVRPISSVAHLRLNTKPEQTHFTIPKIGLTVVFDEIAVGLTKDQYDDVLEMMESMERMSLLSLYRRYRPDLPLPGNSRNWWHYAYTCVLEETVRRRRRMWSWKHIAEYRLTMKRYREVYVKKLDSKKVAADVQKKIDEYEKYLDVFCITIMRQQAEVEAAKLGAKRKEAGNKGWFGGWFGGDKKKAEAKKGGEAQEIQEKFYELYTPEEKTKLYSAIGYEENESDLTLPVEFVAVKVVTKLRNVAIFLRDTRQRDREPQLLKLQLKDVYSSFGQRPAANAIQLEAKVDRMVVSGTPQKDFTPRIITSQTTEKDHVYSLFNVAVETNPLDGSCDTMVKVKSRPLEIIYDAQTINKLADFFTPPESVRLKQFSQAAMAQFEEIKEMSSTGMQHAIEHHKYTDISVDLASSYVMVPQGGVMKNDVHMLVLDLGRLSVVSEKHGIISESKLESLEEKMAKAYDKFSIKLQHIQLLYVHPGENWQAARQAGQSSMHILSPISILLDLGKCIFDRDPRMARMKVLGTLPNISISLSDLRLKEILDLVQSIPLPESAPAAEEEDPLDELLKGPSNLPSRDVSTSHLITKQVAVVAAELEEAEKSKRPDMQRAKSQEYANFIDMELMFEIKEVMVAISQANTPLLKVLVERIGADVKMRTFDMQANAYLGSIYVQHLKYKLSDSISQELVSIGATGGQLINLVNTPTTSSSNQYLLSVSYLQANKKAPEFATMYDNTEQNIQVKFSALELLLHQGAILNLLEFAQSIAPPPAEAPATTTATQKRSVTSVVTKERSGSEIDKSKMSKKRKVKEEDLSIVNMKVVAVLHQFSVGICNNDKLITGIHIKGIEANVAMMKQKITIAALLRDMTILDPDPKTAYPKILQIEGSEVLKADVVVYEGGTEGEKYADMKCVDTSVGVEIGCLKIVFVNKYVNDLLRFVDNFQVAKDKITEAGQVAAQAGMEAVQSLQETATRLGLQVQMKAPVIIIPQNSTSLNTMLVDLGHLSVTNKFHLAGKSSPSGVPAVLEEMRIVLTSTKLSRAHVEKGGKIMMECELLEPVTIALTMHRNLSAAWYHDKPDIDVSGALEPLMLRLSQGDFKTIMQILDENMNEGQPVQGHTPAAVSPEASDSDELGNSLEPAQANTVRALVSEGSWVSIKVDFQIKGVHAFFYSGDTALTKGAVGHNMQLCIGKFELQVIAVAAKIMSDTAIEAKVSLQDTILDDLRPSKSSGITRMIERRKGAGAMSNCMIAVDFSQDASQNKNVKLDVSTLYICVCVEFLMTLADFFTKGMPEPKPAPEVPKMEKYERAAIEMASEAKPPVAATLAAVGSMDVILAMEKPEIILIEDQLNHKTNALVVDMELSFRLRQTPDVQTMNAGLSGFQIFSCTFDKRHQQHMQVLMPCDISLLSSAPGGINPHMDLTISDIVLNITPATIRTITAVSGGLSRPPETSVRSKKERVPDDLWAVRKLANCNFWFLKLVKDSCVDSADKLVNINYEDSPEERGEEQGEELMLGLPSLVVKLEGGIGHRTIPLLIVEASFQAQVRNWSTALCVEGSLDVEVAYYNEKLAVWEPLLEPVIEDGHMRRWLLGLEVKMAEENALGDDSGGEEDSPILLPSKMVVNVTSNDALQMCMTKGCLEVLTNLGKAFNDAYNLVKIEGKKGEVLSPFLFQNHTGFDIILKLDPSFEALPNAVQGRTKLCSGDLLQVFNKKEAGGATKASLIKATQEGDERKIIFQVEQFGATREVTIKRAEKRLFQINQRSHQGDVWSVICATDCPVGQKLIHIRSIVMVRNNLKLPMEVLYRGDTKLETCGVADPNKVLSIPLNAVYSLSNELFFRPVGSNYETSQTSLVWRSAENMGQQEICCPSTQQGHSACFFNVNPVVEEVYFEAGEEVSAKSFIFDLQPTMILHNLLPFTINYLLEGTNEQESLTKGENRPLTHASVSESTLEIVIPSYQGLEWVGRRKLQKNSPQLTVWEFIAHKGAQKLSMELGLHSKVSQGTVDVSLFCPYWLLNKTGCKLAYRGSDQDTPIEHSADTSELILFSFRGHSIFGSKKKDSEKGDTEKKPKDKVREMKQAGKAQLRIQDLDWSDKFSLDTVGSSGTVQCKSKGHVAEVGVSITLSSSGLTKIATFTPFYMFLNSSEDCIMVTEPDQENWFDVAPGQCVPFWPQQAGKEISVKAKIKGMSEVTGPFHINKAHTTLLKLDNEFGGINADCQVSESAMITTLHTYRPGYAAVLIVNHTDRHPLSFHQSGQQRTQQVDPQEALMYAWDDALGKRELVWTCGKKKEVKTELMQDGMEEFFADDDSKVYWVSFLDGLQRVLMFTEDIAVAASAQEAGELEQVEQEINLQIQGLGLSLVNNYSQCEVAFLGITSSGIIWEEKRKRRFRALNLKECLILETAWQKYQNEMAVGKIPSPLVVLENKMEVDFSKMTVIKPRSRGIRRSFENGIWVQYKTSPHQLQLHAKINRIQLDNQLSHAVFPTVLSPLPPPKSVAAESVPKPFTEVSMMMRKHEHSNVQQIKYFKVLIQEMRLNVDQGFLNAILELFAANELLPREQETIQCNEDIVMTQKSLMEHAGLSLAEEQKNFYDYLHFSPIKVHLSFSLQTGTGSSDGKPVEIQAGVINVFLQSVGVVLTDVQDVVFKLGYFERSHNFYNQSQLTAEITAHYAGQAIKQMYVLVLGLDVLGNPFGLLRGLSEGIEDLFYEPYQGAIQGPEEFAEGLALGVRSLFGHAVGGAAGAVSRITGTLGKGLATLTLDDDYQKKRREQLNKRPANAREGFARGGKGLVMGVFDGVTGIVRKPMEGAKQEGVSGFFKGVGKGLVGVVTRPTSGVIDFASSSFEGIRRIAEVQDEIKRLRPPRRFFKDKVIRPYNHQEAEGYAIMLETEKGKYVATDEYQAHVVVSKDGKVILIVTDKRVMLAKRGDIFGTWDCEWTYTWAELKEPPKKTAKGIEIILKEKEKKKFFSSSSTKKDVIIIDQKLSEWIVTKIQEQMNRYK